VLSFVTGTVIVSGVVFIKVFELLESTFTVTPVDKPEMLDDVSVWFAVIIYFPLVSCDTEAVQTPFMVAVVFPINVPFANTWIFEFDSDVPFTIGDRPFTDATVIFGFATTVSADAILVCGVIAIVPEILVTGLTRLIVGVACGDNAGDTVSVTILFTTDTFVTDTVGDVTVKSDTDTVWGLRLAENIALIFVSDVTLAEVIISNLVPKTVSVKVRSSDSVVVNVDDVTIRSDGVSVSDSVVVNAAVVESMSDGVSVSDSVVVNVDDVTIRSDGVSVSDSVVVNW